jgi:hypothetical protein
MASSAENFGLARKNDTNDTERRLIGYLRADGFGFCSPQALLLCSNLPIFRVHLCSLRASFRLVSVHDDCPRFQPRIAQAGIALRRPLQPLLRRRRSVARGRASSTSGSRRSSGWPAHQAFGMHLMTNWHRSRCRPGDLAKSAILGRCRGIRGDRAGWTIPA